MATLLMHPLYHLWNIKNDHLSSLSWQFSFFLLFPSPFYWQFCTHHINLNLIKTMHLCSHWQSTLHCNPYLQCHSMSVVYASICHSSCHRWCPLPLLLLCQCPLLESCVFNKGTATTMYSAELPYCHHLLIQITLGYRYFMIFADIACEYQIFHHLHVISSYVSSAYWSKGMCDTDIIQNG